MDSSGGSKIAVNVLERTKPPAASGRLSPMDGKDLVAAVREAARRHNMTWEMLVPAADRVDSAHEEAEERAYAEMDAARRALRDHIFQTYGLTARELAALATA